MAGQRHLLYVLALSEAGLTLLAMLGQTIFMGGNPEFIVIGAIEATLFVVAGAAAARGRRWGLGVLIVCESVRLAGWGMSELIGLLPWVQLPLTVATLADGLLLPVAVIVLAARLLPHSPPVTTVPVGAEAGR